ncbi:MAG TPA: SDR family oxidoreductase [Ginsengibacter sp.]|nr:SDR family oxidoreductase [Ginsengibacter sp.]
MNGLFKAETVIISGGLGDIGRAIALAFAEQGANIALCDIFPVSHASDDFIDVLTRQFNVKASYHQVDVSDADAAWDWLMSVESEVGVPGIIVANAATVTLAEIREIKPAQWSREIRINLDGAFHLSQFATERLIFYKKPGRVVFMGSWAAHAVHTHIPAYCVSKAGLRMLCKCMAMELAPHGILVNEIAPGFVDAGLSAKVFNEDSSAKSEAIQKVPIQKLITATEVAQQVMMLCHPLNQHMTGSTLLMDGGLSLKC